MNKTCKHTSLGQSPGMGNNATLTVWGWAPREARMALAASQGKPELVENLGEHGDPGMTRGVGRHWQGQAIAQEKEEISLYFRKLSGSKVQNSYRRSATILETNKGLLQYSVSIITWWGNFFWSNLSDVLYAYCIFIAISIFRLGKFSSIVLLKTFPGPLSYISSSILIILRFGPFDSLTAIR